MSLLNNRIRRPISFATAPSRVRPEFQAEADINRIVGRYRTTGHLPVGERVPRYEDFSGAVDYHQALNVVQDAMDAFAGLPARTRDSFDNDPAAFLAAVEEARAPDADPALVQQLRDLHILPPAPTPPPASDPAPTPPAAPETPPAAE